MFEYLDPDASGASHLPPSQSAKPQPQPEKVRHLLYGSLAGLERTIKILHAQGYADPNDWSDPLPVPPDRTPAGRLEPVHPWMVILTKTVTVG